VVLSLSDPEDIVVTSIQHMLATDGRPLLALISLDAKRRTGFSRSVRQRATDLLGSRADHEGQDELLGTHLASVTVRAPAQTSLSRGDRHSYIKRRVAYGYQQAPMVPDLLRFLL
jgi:hypothetical protein